MPYNEHLFEPWMIIAAAVKGTIMAALILGIAETTFIQSFILAVSSASITGGFLVLASYIQAKHTGEKVDEVAAKVETVQQGVNSEADRHSSDG